MRIIDILEVLTSTNHKKIKISEKELIEIIKLSVDNLMEEKSIKKVYDYIKKVYEYERS
jgi:hypothetical protein